MRRFEDVDIISALQKIVDNNNLFYKTDFNYDAETLKTAAEGDRFLWLSRYGGTWLMNERDAHIRNTYDYNTWGYYTDTKYYGVKAFAVEVTDNNNGRPLGNIYELNYDKHREEVRRSSFNASSVDVTFKPAHWDRGATATTRTIDVVEYNDNWRAIRERYGQAESVRHNLSSEDESALAKILGNFKKQYEKETAPGNIAEYIRDMVRERFHEYGYARDDMAFTTPDDARAALKHLIPVYILHKDNTAEKIQYWADVDIAMRDGFMLGMGGRDKKLLNFYTAGNTLADLPFSHRELSTIFHMALDRGKENIEDEQQRKAVDGIIKVLDTVLFSDDGRDVEEIAFERDYDEGMEQ